MKLGISYKMKYHNIFLTHYSLCEDKKKLSNHINAANLSLSSTR